MKKDAKYLVKKAIPLGNGKSIPVNTSIYRTHGCIYMNGGLLEKSYMEDFERLIAYEEKTGWNYLIEEKF